MLCLSCQLMCDNGEMPRTVPSCLPALQVPGTAVTCDQRDEASHQAVRGYVQRVHDVLHAQLADFLSPAGPPLPSNDIEAVAVFHRCHDISDKVAVGAVVRSHLEGLLGSAPVTDPDLGVLMQLLREDRQQGRLPGDAAGLQLESFSPTYTDSQFMRADGTGPDRISIALVWYEWVIRAQGGVLSLPYASTGMLDHFMVVRPAPPALPAKRQKVT